MPQNTLVKPTKSSVVHFTTLAPVPGTVLPADGLQAWDLDLGLFAAPIGPPGQKGEVGPVVRPQISLICYIALW